LKIKVGSIPEEGLDLEFFKDGDWLRQVLPEEERPVFPLHRVDVCLSVKKVGKTVSLEVKAETVVDLECCRCLDGFTFPIKAEFQYILSPAEEQFEEEVELTSEDLLSGYYKNDVIELAPVIFEQILLQIPIKPVCSDSCKGLCPHCGVNLNEEACQCQVNAVDFRLAVLKNFKVLKEK
jgi:uncharacterized protein